jgi:hypothetical protein
LVAAACLQAEGVCYQSLYNAGAAQDAFAAFWGQSALSWRDNTNILGYEVSFSCREERIADSFVLGSKAHQRAICWRHLC